MYKKTLIIFLFSVVMSYFIYKNCDNKRYKVLILGDNYLIDNYNYLNYLKEYLVDNYVYKTINTSYIGELKSYNDITNDIKNNKYVIEKGEKVFLNQVIARSDIIIISANNKEINNKCGKENYVLNGYVKSINSNLNELITLIDKLNNGKLFVIGNYCKDKKININVKNSYIDLSNAVNKSSSFLEFNGKLSKEGHRYIYENIYNVLNK